MTKTEIRNLLSECREQLKTTQTDLDLLLEQQIVLEDKQKKWSDLISKLEAVLTIVNDEDIEASTISDKLVEFKVENKVENIEFETEIESEIINTNKVYDSENQNKTMQHFKHGELIAQVTSTLKQSHRGLTPVEIMSDVRKRTNKTTSVGVVQNVLRKLLRRNEVMQVHNKWVIVR